MKRVSARDRKQSRVLDLPLAPQPVANRSWWLPALAILAAVIAILAYSPALHGEFVFDDLHLPFLQPGAIAIPLTQWLSVRPLLMFTYWINLHLSGVEPFPYHLVNLCFHLTASAVLFAVVRKILLLAGFPEARRNAAAALCAVIFLLHPMQTEAVSYVAQRGESMGAVLFLFAWALFLYRRQAAISWPVSLGVLTLYAAAVATKEHTITLPAVLLLTDYFFHPAAPATSGIRRNWRLYLPIAVLGAVGSIFVARYISRDTVSIGFNLKEFTWYQYFFTQCRGFFFYLTQFVLPLWQTADHDFPVSRSLFDHGAAFALLGILALIGVAIVFRKRYPLASFGFLLFVIILLPTSSIIPIKDVMADRRLYLPMVGLLFIVAEALRRFRYTVVLALALLMILATATWARNNVWSSSLNLWEDAAEKAPGKQRVQFGLAVAEFRAGRCHAAVDAYRRASEIEKPDYALLMNWSLALECDHQPAQAIAKMQESLRDKPTAQAWASMGVLYARQGKVDEAMDALMKGQVIDPTYMVTYLYRARILQAMNRIPEAIQNVQMIVETQPTDESAQLLLRQLQGQAH